MKTKTNFRGKTLFTPITRYHCECWLCLPEASFFIRARGDANHRSSSKSILQLCFVIGTTISFPSPFPDVNTSPGGHCHPSQCCPFMKIASLNQEMCPVTQTRETLEKKPVPLNQFDASSIKMKTVYIKSEGLCSSERAKHKCFSDDILFSADSV